MSNTDYSELYGILLMLGKSYILKLPDDIVQQIKNNRDVNYEPEYSIDSIMDNNISPTVLDYLADLYLLYWQEINE